VNEIIFLVEDAPEGGFTARALDASIFTEADDISDLHDKVRDAVECHFEPSKNNTFAFCPGRCSVRTNCNTIVTTNS
jgi:hypothetical protein